jgi:hypothetical protein
LRQEIGLGQAEAVVRVEIKWPTGVTQTIKGLALDGSYTIREDNDRPRETVLRSFRWPGPSSKPLPHRHMAGSTDSAK